MKRAFEVHRRSERRVDDHGRSGVRRLGTAAVALLTAAAGLSGATTALADDGCVLVETDVAVPVPAGVTLPGTATSDRVNVVLPASYCSEPTAAYPVVLLLHGAGDTYATWMANTDVEDFVHSHEGGLDVIVVMPDGGRSPDSGWYSDWADGSRDWETFHLDVVMPWVEANYRTTGRWGVAGLSMGGFGAMKYAARDLLPEHTDDGWARNFEVAASFSGAVDTMHGWPVQGFGFEAAHDQFGTPDDRVWGDHIEAEDEWRAHNPTDLADELLDTRLLLTTGTGTPGGHAGDDPANPGGYAVEQAIWQMNTSFWKELKLHGADVNDDYFYPGGLHSWPYWEAALHWALPQMEAQLLAPSNDQPDDAIDIGVAPPAHARWWHQHRRLGRRGVARQVGVVRRIGR